jgi:hypothetical protein
MFKNLFLLQFPRYLYGTEFTRMKTMLFFKWKRSFLTVIKRNFEVEKSMLKDHLEEHGYTTEQYDSFCKEAKSYIRWINRLTPKKLASTNYCITYITNYFLPGQSFEEYIETFFDFLLIDTIEPVYVVPIITFHRFNHPNVCNMTISEFVESRGF